MQRGWLHDTKFGNAILVNFDDLSTTGAGSPISSGYDGFVWSAGPGPLYIILDNVEIASSGFGAMARSLGVTNVAFDPIIDQQGDAAQPIDIHRTDGSPFIFNSVYVASAWAQLQQVTITGYGSHGQIVGTVTEPVTNSNVTLFQVNWGPISDLKITSTEQIGSPPGVTGDLKDIVLSNFSFSISAGNGGSIAGSTLLNDAITYLETTWGNENCTGFGYTVAHDVSLTFFDLSQQAKSEIGPYGTFSPSLGTQYLLNTKYGPTGDTTDGLNSFPFSTPISDAGVPQPHPNDDFHLVADSGDHETSAIHPGNNGVNLPQPGDIFRGVVEQANGGTITHEGIVAAYDASTKTVWLVDNFVSDHAFVGGPLTGTAEIGYHQFNLNSNVAPTVGHPTIVGPYAFYRANNSSLDDNIMGSSGNDYLGGGSGDDVIFGGAGNDTLWGGTGSNMFVYGPGWGHDAIQDWSSGTANLIDMTALASVEVHRLSDLKQSLVNQNDVITYGSDTITLVGVHHALAASSFSFA